jgi:hypothetical protein
MLFEPASSPSPKLARRFPPCCPSRSSPISPTYSLRLSITASNYSSLPNAIFNPLFIHSITSYAFASPLRSSAPPPGSSQDLPRCRCPRATEALRGHAPSLRPKEEDGRSQRAPSPPTQARTKVLHHQEALARGRMGLQGRRRHPRGEEEGQERCLLREEDRCRQGSFKFPFPSEKLRAGAEDQGVEQAGNRGSRTSRGIRAAFTRCLGNGFADALLRFHLSQLRTKAAATVNAPGQEKLSAFGYN